MPIDHFETGGADFAFGQSACGVVVLGVTVADGRATVDDDQKAEGPQRAVDVGEDCGGVVKLVKRVGDQDGVDGAGGKLRVIGGAVDDVDIAIVAERSADAQEDQGQLANIFGENFAARADSRRQLHREIAGAAAEIDNPASFVQAESADDFRGSLPLIAIFFDCVELMEGRDELPGDWQNDQGKEHAEKEDEDFGAEGAVVSHGAGSITPLKR